jgi:4-hydroxybenzoate polyprenyltransferase
MIKKWFQALRIKHWIKNFFVIAPFLVGPRFGINEYLIYSVEGVLLFCLMSSAVYLFNDIVDIKHDREHPEKRLRPIASGHISVRAAGMVSTVLAISSIASAFYLDFSFALLLIAYAVNNILYSFYLKKKTVLDVMSIAFGFVIRVYAGGFVIGIEITKWLVACVFTLSIFLGFGKRRLEFEALKDSAAKARDVNESYTIQKLNILLGISASITIVTYMLYTMAPETRELQGTDKLIFTTPFVVYGIYRYLLKVQEGRHSGPVELMLKDKGFLLAGVLWIIAFMLLTR